MVNTTMRVIAMDTMPIAPITIAAIRSVFFFFGCSSSIPDSWCKLGSTIALPSSGALSRIPPETIGAAAGAFALSCSASARKSINPESSLSSLLREDDPDVAAAAEVRALKENITDDSSRAPVPVLSTGLITGALVATSSSEPTLDAAPNRSGFTS